MEKPTNPTATHIPRPINPHVFEFVKALGALVAKEEAGMRARRFNAPYTRKSKDEDQDPGIWAILTATRGPDGDAFRDEHQAVKDRTTTIVRAMLEKLGFDGNAIHGTVSGEHEVFLLLKEDDDIVSTHFIHHVLHAAMFLGLATYDQYVGVVFGETSRPKYLVGYSVNDVITGTTSDHDRVQKYYDDVDARAEREAGIEDSPDWRG